MYYDKRGAPIAFEDYKAKRKDPSYTIIEQFDNQEVKLSIEWLGKVRDAARFPDISYWPLFQINVWNGMPLSDGTVQWVNDPRSGETYGSEAAAREAYREFLLEWTDCKLVEDKKGDLVFKEEGNILAPPPPPDLNTPTSVETVLTDDVGAW